MKNKRKTVWRAMSTREVTRPHFKTTDKYPDYVCETFCEIVKIPMIVMEWDAKPTKNQWASHRGCRLVKVKLKT